MSKHAFHRIFRDLLSLHGYPMPFESSERLAAAEAPSAGRATDRQGDRQRLPVAGPVAIRTPGAPAAQC